MRTSRISLNVPQDMLQQRLCILFRDAVLVAGKLSRFIKATEVLQYVGKPKMPGFPRWAAG